MLLSIPIYFLLCYASQAQEEETYYATNFKPGLKWDNNIVYNIFATTDTEKFSNFVRDSIRTFTSKFKSPLNWIEEPNWDRLRQNRRYFIFNEHDVDIEDPCYLSTPSAIGPSVLFIGINDVCGTAENMAGILETLGFGLTILRADRDEHVKIIWENIGPITAAMLNQTETYFMKSTNEAFSIYDVASVLHPSAYYEDAIDPEKPIFEPRNPVNAVGLNLRNEERQPTKMTSASLMQFMGPKKVIKNILIFLPVMHHFIW
uniref:Peptidase M12A domain-containing protein n=1 Tax=Panagrolaimus superbus TaxID=310955 RepID=A0A914YJM8_9BILA